MSDMLFKALKVKAAVDDPEAGTFTAHVAAFGNVDHDRDIIEPGAFTKTLAEHGGVFPMLWQHDPHEPIGASLKMEEDGKGLAVYGRVSMKAPRGPAALELLQMGGMQGFSIGYFPVKAERDTDRKGVTRLKELRLFEFSAVTFPANPLATLTSAKARRLLDEAAELLSRGGSLTPEDREQMLKARDALTALIDGTEPPAGTPHDEGAATKGAELAEMAAELRSILTIPSGR